MIELVPLWRALDPVEARVLRAIRSRPRPLLDRVVVALGRSGENGFVWCLLGCAFASIDRQRWRPWIIVGILGPLAIGPNWLIKKFTARPRPDLGPDLKPLADVRPSSYSFPSSHATSSFAAAALAFRIEPRSGYVTLPLAVLLSAGRPYMGVHNPSDVLAGAAFGTGLGLLSFSALAANCAGLGLRNGR